MDAAVITTPLAAFAVGLATSVHCAVMCGPLACALRVRAVEYHLGRLVSYTCVGALAGGAGAVVLRLFQGSVSHFLPWMLAAVLALIGFGLEKRLPQPRALSTLLLRLRLQRSLGWLTPLLPCGPLWLMIGVSSAAGSWPAGATLMASFAAGSIPLPWIVLAHTAKLGRRMNPLALRWAQQSIALISAALLVWRALLPIHASCH